ncbi:Dicer-like protein 1 [Rhodotorula toruloides]
MGEKHPLPVHSPSNPPRPPPPPAHQREPTTEVRPLTAQQPRMPVAPTPQAPAARPSPAQAGRLVTSSSSFLTKKKKRKGKKGRQINKDADLEVGAVEGGGTGRVIVPPSAGSGPGGASAAAAAGTYKQPRVKVRVKGPSSGRMALPSQSRSFRNKNGGPSSSKSASLPQATPDHYRPVQTSDGSLAFTRSRGSELDRSIAAVLQKRPAEILDEYEKDSRTKRQKTAAEELKRLMLAEEDEDEKGNESDEESLAGGLAGGAKDDEAWVEEDDDLVVQPSVPPLMPAHQAANEPATLDLFATPSTAPLFPPIKPFVFPAPTKPTPAQPRAVPTVQRDVITQGSLVQHREAEVQPVDVENVAEDEEHAATSSLPAVESITSSASAELAPAEDVKLAAKSAAAASAPIAPLPRALPLPSATTLPTPALRSAALLLATKRRKPLTKARKARLRRAPQLFDYLSDQESEDWEDLDVGGEKEWMKKRPKNGRAMEGRMDPLEKEDEDEEGKVKVDRDILPSARAHVDKLVPTSYQTALLERAKKGNLITVLGTGSGKTLVAVLLIEWQHKTVEEERIKAGQPKRMQFFLTNSVPLVHQQANTLACNTSLRVGKLFGALGVNLCSPSEWAYNFENFDCLVVTAQLVLDSLAHGFLRMEQIALLVFDEAHHAKSNHPFASILRDFYHRAPVNQRPRILGLTASPLDSNEGVEEAKKLEALFDAKLVSAPPETQAELRAMVARPTILRVDYDPAPSYFRTDLFDKVMSKVVIQDDTFKKYYQGAESVLRDLGPDAADLVWHLALQRYKAKFLPHLPPSDVEDDADESAMEVERELLGSKMASTSLDNGEGGAWDGRAVIESGREARKVTKAEQKRLARKEEKQRIRNELREKALEELNLELPDWLRIIKEHTPSLDYERLSPKLQKLLDLLKACRPGADDFCGIIFVNRRLDALVIAQIIKEFAKLEPDLAWLKVDCVTGHGTGTGNALGPRMAWHEQAAVLTGFGEGETNLLVATSVVEEGLDVQPCNFVARFDLYTSHIAYIQSRGRARAPGSHYLLFLEKGNLEEKKKLLQIAHFDRDLFTFFERIQDEIEDEDEDFYGAADERCTYLVESSTGAVLTPHFSLSLLQRYSNSLPKSDEFTVTRPQYTINDYGVNEFGARQFSCTIVLPSASKVRVVTGPLCETQAAAKRSAAFATCKVLRNVGCLDEHFLPPRTFPDEEVVDADTGEVVGSKKRQCEYEKKVPDALIPRSPCGDVTTFYATFLHYGSSNGETTISGQRYRPVLFLSRNPLPPVDPLTMYLAGEPVKIFATPVGAIPLTTEQRRLITDWDVQLWQSVLNKPLRVARGMVEGEEGRTPLDLIWLIAAVKDGIEIGTSGIKVDDVNWDGMRRIKEVKLDHKNLSGLEDSVVIDMAKNGCRYFFERIRQDLHPYETLPPGRQSDAGFSTLMDYYTSFNEPFFHSVRVDPDQPLLEISRMPKTVTHLNKTPKNDVTPTAKKLLAHATRFAISQACYKHPLAASIFRTALMLPSIITDLEQSILTAELNKKVFGNALAFPLVKAALTTPSASIGIDGDRLELLGDALLKHIISTFVFVSQDRTTHEGVMHRLRLALVNNAYLCTAGKKLAIPSYLVSRPFTSRHFLPPNLCLVDSKNTPPPSTAVIGDKTIADAVEALVGAAVETGFEEGELHKAYDLALAAIKTIGIEIGSVTVWNDFARLYGPIGEEREVEGERTLIEKAIGWKFRHAFLATEAFTHPSRLDMVSFERTEWLGDAILDVCVVRWTWKRWGEELGPGTLTELKGGCVSNDTLAALAVELDLDNFLIYNHPTLEINIKLYRERLLEAREKEFKEAAEEQRSLRPYWLTLDPPKAVADIIESLFGAVYIDSGFDPAAPQQIFDHCLAPFFQKWISPTSLKLDCIRILLERAQAAQCDDVSHVSSTLEPRFDQKTGELISRLTRTSVVAHNNILGTIESGNPKTAKRLASDLALSYLDQNPGFFSYVCDCSTRRNLARELAEEEAERLRNEGLISDIDETDVSEYEQDVEGKGEGDATKGEMEVDA